MEWFKYSEVLPPIGEEVLAFNEKWIDDDNPKGIRIGFLSSEYGFTTAYWCDMQDDYMSISKSNLNVISDYFLKQGIEYIEPEWWCHLPIF